MAKDTQVFQLSDSFKDHLATWAQTNNRSVSDVIREAVAQFTDYDLEGEPETERRRKYATLQERNDAMKARAKERRDIQRELVEAIRRGEKIEAIEALAASLKRK